jgi:hypothetical protein
MTTKTIKKILLWKSVVKGKKGRANPDPAFSYTCNPKSLRAVIFLLSAREFS